MDLQGIWNQLCSTYSSDENILQELWSEVQSKYTAPFRHYHNLGHLEFMFNLALEYRDEIHEFDTLCFSIFYHDVIYLPGKNDNEEKSAEFAVESLNRLSFPIKETEKCQAQILVTKGHVPTSDKDTRYFLDFDLAILGQETTVYIEYATQVQGEFNFLSEEEYRTGRKAVLMEFLNREMIFKTPRLHQLYEQKARENMRMELENL